jgi:hypothetical protein
LKALRSASVGLRVSIPPCPIHIKCLAARQQRNCGSAFSQRKTSRTAKRKGLKRKYRRPPGPNLSHLIYVLRDRGIARKNACGVCLRYLRYVVSSIHCGREFQIFFRAMPRSLSTHMGESLWLRGVAFNESSLAGGRGIGAESPVSGPVGSSGGPHRAGNAPKFLKIFVMLP